MIRAPHGFLEDIFLGETQRQRHAPIARQKLADDRNLVALDVFEQQRRTVGPLVVNLTDRAQLMLGVDFGFDLDQLVLFFLNLEKFP